jgi:predicted Zn-dependent peptidase
MSNGNYYYVKTPNDLISVISLWSSRGSSLDPKGKEGLSHYFEHLFLNKTASLPNKIAVLRKIDGSGLFFNAYTSKNAVYYYFIQRAQDQEEAYKILIQGLQEFYIEAKDVEREKEVILNEQNQHTANPSVYVWSLADKGLWPDSPLGVSSLGTKSSVSSITIDDILMFKELLFTKENIGFLTISSLKISSSLEDELIKLTTSSVTPQTSYVDNINTGKSQKIICEYRPSNSVYLAISFPLPGLKSLKKDKLILDFIRNYLASGWSSKLIERLRMEKNYTYWVYGGIESFYEAGYFRISLSTTKKHIVEIINIVVEEIQKLQQEKMDEEQLAHHKNAMKAHLLKHYIQPENMLWWYGWNIFLANRVMTIGEYLDSIDDITSSEVQTSALKYLPIGNMHIAALGNVLEDDLSVAVSGQ